MGLQFKDLKSGENKFIDTSKDPNYVLGQQLVQKDIEILKLQASKDSLGEQVVDHDIRLLLGGL
jgi:hypothetical protein